MTKQIDVLCFLLLLIILIPLEIMSGFLAYETIGAIVSAIYFATIITVNLIAAIIAFRFRTLAMMIIIVTAVAIIPYQIALGQRMMNLERETTYIVTYAYEKKLQNGAFPKDLSGYTFQNPEISKFISYSAKPDRFRVEYFVGTPTTSHSYDSQIGWSYYPD